MTACNALASETSAAGTDHPIWQTPCTARNSVAGMRNASGSQFSAAHETLPRQGGSKHEDYAALMKEASALRSKGQTERAQRVAQVAFNILLSR